VLSRRYRRMAEVIELTESATPSDGALNDDETPLAGIESARSGAVQNTKFGAEIRKARFNGWVYSEDATVSNQEQKHGTWSACH
jgi:hypothetical protein